jgi:hypothetical protein
MDLAWLPPVNSGVLRAFWHAASPRNCHFASQSRESAADVERRFALGIGLTTIQPAVLGPRREYRGSDLQLNARSKPYSRVDLKLTIAVLICIALAIGIALFLKYLINR